MHLPSYPGQARTEKDIKCAPSDHLGTLITWETYFSFQPQDEGSAPTLDVTMWEGLADLVLEHARPMAVCVCLSQLSRLSLPHPMMEFRTSGLTAQSGHYGSPSGCGWPISFTSF